MKDEGRLLQNFSGNNLDVHMNFVPKMNYDTLIEGYKHILDTIYSPKEYCERLMTFLKEYKPPKIKDRSTRLRSHHVEGFLKSIWVLGIREKGRRYYWKLVFSTLFKNPRAFPLSISLSVMGFHFRKVAEKLVLVKSSAPTAG